MTSADTAEILTRIRTGAIEREQVARELLQDDKLLAGIRKIVISKGGSSEEAHSIVHWTIVSFFKKVLQDREFSVDTDIYRYLNGVAKYLWYAELRKNTSIEVYSEKEESAVNPGHDVKIIDRERKDYYIESWKN